MSTSRKQHQSASNSSLEETTVILLARFTDKEKLIWRQLNKTTRHVIQSTVNAPYQNRSQFSMAMTGRFRESRYALKELLASAWEVYDTTLKSRSQHPALLYKLRDDHASLIQHFTRESRGDDLNDEGRRYAPPRHIWYVNQVWMLAQLHKHRPFIICSTPHDHTLFRQHHSYQHPRGYSAFAKEIAIAIHAGYALHINYQNNTIQLSLLPSGDNHLTSISIKNIDLTEQEIRQATEFVKLTRESFIKDRLLASPARLFSAPASRTCKPPFATRVSAYPAEKTLFKRG